MIRRALDRLGVTKAIVLGHSWGASVAVALALKFPDFVRGLVLASGYYYPTLRPDVVALSAPAIPVLGDVMGHTLSPMISRLICPLMTAKIFGPKSAPAKFGQFPKEMALRPSQIRASAAESALMIPDAFHFEGKYADLKMPVVIIAGEEDRLIDIHKQSARLHSDVSQSAFHSVPGNGHMIHQTATSEVMAAINEVAGNRPLGVRQAVQVSKGLELVVTADGIGAGFLRKTIDLHYRVANRRIADRTPTAGVFAIVDDLQFTFDPMRPCIGSNDGDGQ